MLNANNNLVGIGILPTFGGNNPEIPKAYLIAQFYNADNQPTQQKILYVTTNHYAWNTLGEIQEIALENGRVEIFVANESNTRVFFDDLSIYKSSTPIVQENHYYPFGMNLVGIEKEGTPNHRFQFMGKEKESSFGLNWTETDWRGYEGQLGRFWQVDKMADKYWDFTPYHYVGNNPVNMTDPSGLEGEIPDQHLDEVEITASRLDPDPKPEKIDKSFFIDFKNGKPTNNTEYPEIEVTASRIHDQPTTFFPHVKFPKIPSAEELWKQINKHVQLDKLRRMVTEIPTNVSTLGIFNALVTYLSPKLSMVLVPTIGTILYMNSHNGGNNLTDKENVDDEWLKVGRWMSKDEYELMKTSGRMQEGAGGLTFVSTNGIDDYRGATQTGNIYVEFEVLKRNLLQGGKEGWYKSVGPNAMPMPKKWLSKQLGEFLPSIRNLSNILDTK
jgi:RHS repeat-associated protein